MTVAKFWASWEKENGENEVINAFKGLNLKDDAIIMTVPKEKGQLYDVETGLQVLPRKGRKNGKGQPYFSYYPHEESSNKDNSSSFEYTAELNVFLRAFDGIKRFKIKERKKKEVVEISVEKSYKLHRIETVDGYFIVKIYIELLETKPYSFFYKYNGKLALEFLATSAPTPLKKVMLTDKGVPLFEAKAMIPKWISETLPDEFETEEQFEYIARRIHHTYSERNYRLQGEFGREVVTLPDFKERYEKMDRFEQQCKEMEDRISLLTDEVGNLKKENAMLDHNIRKQQKLLAEEKEQLEAYRRENEYYIRVERDNETLLKENEQMKQAKEICLGENKKLLEKKETLSRETQIAEEKLQDTLNRQTWLSRLLMKKRK